MTGFMMVEGGSTGLVASLLTIKVCLDEQACLL